MVKPKANAFQLNLEDFEFLGMLLRHAQLTTEMAVALLEILSEIARKHIIFTRVSLGLLHLVLQKFDHNLTFQASYEQMIKSLVREIQEQDAAKLGLFKKIESNPAFRAVKARKRAKKDKHSTLAQTEREQQNRSPMQKIYDDRHLSQFLHSKSKFFEESNQFIQIKLQEKLTINLFQFFLNNACQYMQEYLRNQLVLAYVTLEQSKNYLDNGLYYLLTMKGEDGDQLIEKERKRVMRRKTKLLQEEREQRQLKMQSFLQLRRRQSGSSVGGDAQMFEGLPGVRSSFSLSPSGYLNDGASYNDRENAEFGPYFRDHERSLLVQKQSLSIPASMA